MMIRRCITVFLLLPVFTFYGRTFAIEEDELLKLKNTFISKDVEPDNPSLKDVGSHDKIQKHNDLWQPSTLLKRQIKDSGTCTGNIAKNVRAITKEYEKQNRNKEYRQRRVRRKHDSRRHRKGHIRQQDRKSNFQQRKTSKVRNSKRRKTRRHFRKPRRRKSRIRNYHRKRWLGSIRTIRRKYKRHNLRKRIFKIRKYTRRTKPKFYRYRHSRRWQHRIIVRKRYFKSAFLPDHHHNPYKLYKDDISSTHVRGLKSLTSGNRRWSPPYVDWSHQGTPRAFRKQGVVSVQSRKRPRHAWKIRTHHSRTWYRRDRGHRRRNRIRRQRKHKLGGLQRYAFIHRHRYYRLIQNRHKTHFSVYRHCYFNSGKIRNPSKSIEANRSRKRFHQNEYRNTRKNKKPTFGNLLSYSRIALREKGAGFRGGYLNIKIPKRSTSDKSTKTQTGSYDSKSKSEHPWIN